MENVAVQFLGKITQNYYNGKTAFLNEGNKVEIKFYEAAVKGRAQPSIFFAKC